MTHTEPSTNASVCVNALYHYLICSLLAPVMDISVQLIDLDLQVSAHFEGNLLVITTDCVKSANFMFWCAPSRRLLVTRTLSGKALWQLCAFEWTSRCQYMQGTSSIKRVAWRF